jgi:hypothetical protein
LLVSGDDLAEESTIVDVVPRGSTAELTQQVVRQV